MTGTELVPLMCDFCGWEDDSTWIYVEQPDPAAMLEQYRRGFSVCGFCSRSLVASRWLAWCHSRTLMRDQDFAPAQDQAQFANIQRALILGRSVSVLGRTSS